MGIIAVVVLAIGAVLCAAAYVAVGTSVLVAEKLNVLGWLLLVVGAMVGLVSLFL